MAGTSKPGHRLVAFEGWESGEYSAKAPHRAPTNSFTGLNVLRYENGCLGPRFGLKELTLSGTVPTGIIRGFGINPTLTVAASNSIWFVVGSKAYIMDAAGVVTECSGSFASPATGAVYGVPVGAGTYLAGGGIGAVYKINHGTAALSAVASSPSLLNLFRYGQVLLGATVADFSEMRYSNPADPDTWPSGNFFEVGAPASAITAVVNQRDHLVICKIEGAWFILRGSLGQTGNIQSAGTASLRSISDAVAALAPESIAALGDGTLAYVLGNWSSVIGGDQSSLYIHTGSDVKPIRHLRWPSVQGFTTIGPTHFWHVQALRQPADWFVLSPTYIAPGEMAMKARGSWSFHQFDPPGSDVPARAMGLKLDDTWFFTDGGGASAQPKMWVWRSYASRPAFTSDSGAQPGDASTTPIDAYFTTSEWLSDAGFEAKVEAVTIDFRAYATGSASSNHFDVNVLTTKAFDRSDIITSTTASFDDPSGSLGAATVEGKHISRRFQLGGTEWGRGFKVKLSAIRGVAIERVLVHVTVKESRAV